LTPQKTTSFSTGFRTQSQPNALKRLQRLCEREVNILRPASFLARRTRAKEDLGRRALKMSSVMFLGLNLWQQMAA
jgi:hypothetical protein